MDTDWNARLGLYLPKPGECTCWKCLDGKNVALMVLCPTCGNKRCPKANDHQNDCSGSNEPGQVGSAYEATPAERKRPGFNYAEASCSAREHHKNISRASICAQCGYSAPTEQKAAFAVGQSVRVTGYLKLRQGSVGKVLGFNSAQDGLWSVRFADGVGRYEASELEIADPAPPAEPPLTRSELVVAQIGSVVWYRGQRSRVTATQGRADAVKQVHLVEEPFAGWVAVDELEKRKEG